MYGKGTLAATGIGFTILGISMSLSMVAAIVVAAVIAGGLTFRFAKRKKRYVA